MFVPVLTLASFETPQERAYVFLDSLRSRHGVEMMRESGKSRPLGTK